MKGIDVSTIQGAINWKAVASAGYKFAMIKATQGRGEGVATQHLRRFTDSKFKKNIVEASKAGLACGVYHYMTAKSVSEAREEAGYFCSMINPYRSHILLWAAVDVESERYLGGISKIELAAIVQEFMEVVDNYGFKPMLYTNPNYIKYRFPENVFKDSDIWLAHYGVKEPYKVPNTQMWQWGLGKIAGIKGDVDMNEGYFPGVIPAIAKLASLGVVDTPTYWLDHYSDVPFLDELLIKSADRLISGPDALLSFDAALKRLEAVGIVNTPAYWVANAPKAKYLTDLICKIGGSV